MGIGFSYKGESGSFSISLSWAAIAIIFVLLYFAASLAATSLSRRLRSWKTDRDRGVAQPEEQQRLMENTSKASSTDELRESTSDWHIDERKLVKHGTGDT